MAFLPPIFHIIFLLIYFVIVEFQKAWKFLGLEGTEDEIENAYRGVDVDNSGFISRSEFMAACKDSRSTELSLSVLLTQMDGHLEGMEGFFDNYKNKLEKSKQRAQADLANSEERFKKFQATARRRRLMKKAMDAKIGEITRELITQIEGGAAEGDNEQREIYNTVRDTFNAFDRDGSAEMAFPEYLEPWRFLNQPGEDAQVKQAFDSVDVDESGVVDFDEFVFSIMGEDALKYGKLAALEKLVSLLEGVMKDYALVQDTLNDARANSETRADRNAELRARLENMRSEVGGQINDLISKMMGVNPEDVLTDEEINAHLKEAFERFDEDNSGQLGKWEFVQAWMFLGLKGNESEIHNSFDEVDADSSGLVSLNEFTTAIRSSRLTELSLSTVLQKMGVQLNNMDGQYESFKAQASRRRLMKKTYEENVAKTTKEIITKLSMFSKTEVPEKDADTLKV